jgi:hypothetical protein
MVAIGWVDPDTLDTLWSQSTQLEDGDLVTILQASYLACAAYAPPMPLAPAADGSGALVPTVPESWKLAQVMHAKHLWARFRSGNAESIGPDGYTISTYPLVLEARSLLRPKRPAFKGLR